jgi:uncharacterized protein YggE
MKILKNSILISTIALLLFNSCSASSAPVAIERDTDAIITVTGTGQMDVEPDVGMINIGVRSQGATVVDAIAINNQQSNAIQTALSGQGVAGEDIQTSNFNVYQQSDYDFQGNPVSTYYSVENTVYVTVRQLENLGDILDAVARSGANNIYGVNFDAEDKSQAQTAARKLAVQSAQAQAIELAEAAGVELGEMVSITTSPAASTPFYGYGMGGGGGMAESVPISTGMIPIIVQVEITYRIK